MFIGICDAICSGKRSIAHYLVDKHNFQLLQLISSQASSSIAPSLAQTPEPVQDTLGDAYNQLLFNTPGEMLE
jgi:dCMP deaminase